MPSSKKQKLSKEEKSRRKQKSHSSKDPNPEYFRDDWSRSKNLKLRNLSHIQDHYVNNYVNNYFSKQLEELE